MSKDEIQRRVDIFKAIDASHYDKKVEWENLFCDGLIDPFEIDEYYSDEGFVTDDKEHVFLTIGDLMLYLEDEIQDAFEKLDAKLAKADNYDEALAYYEDNEFTSWGIWDGLEEHLFYSIIVDGFSYKGWLDNGKSVI